MIEINNILKAQINHFNNCLEEYEILLFGNRILGENTLISYLSNVPVTESASLLDGKSEENLSFLSKSGIIKADLKPSFERILYRMTRQHCYICFSDMKNRLIDIETGEEDINSRFTIFYIYYRSKNIEEKIMKVSKAFNASLHDIPNLNSKAENELKIKNYEDRINESHYIYTFALQDKMKLLDSISKYFNKYCYNIREEKLIYSTLNQCMYDKGSMISCEFWTPKSVIHEINEILKTNVNYPIGILQRVDKSDLKPPTYIETNSFTYIYQLMTNTYGIPRYREINPSVFNLITFPLMFGIMYGDIGHGKSIINIRYIIADHITIFNLLLSSK